MSNCENAPAAKFNVDDKVRVTENRGAKFICETYITKIGKRDIILANGMRADLEGLVFVSGLRCPMFGRRIEVVK